MSDARNIRSLRVGGDTFALLDEGRGPPVLLVHGFPLDHTMWSAQIAALTPRHRVLAPDLRGFGGSVVTEGTVTMPQFADDLAALLDALDITERVTYVGFSMGGYIAWPFVQRHARRLNGLVLCDTRAVGDTPEGAEGRLAMADRVEAEGAKVAADAMLPKLLAPGRAERDPQLAATLRATMLATDPRGIAAAQRGMAQRADATPKLRDLNLPTLVIVGEHDAIAKRDEMRALAKAIPRSRFVEVPGAGHTAPMEEPDAVNVALLSFVESLR